MWGLGHVQPSDKYLKKQLRLMQKYPLPETWKAVYDPGWLVFVHFYVQGDLLNLKRAGEDR